MEIDIIERILTLVKDVVMVIIRIVRRISPSFNILCTKYFVKKKNRTILKLYPISFNDYCNLYGGKIITIEEEQDRKVLFPAYYPYGQEKEYNFNSPSIYISELNDVIVHGGSGMVISGDKVLTDICSQDVDNRIQYRFGTVVSGNNKKIYLDVDNSIKDLDRAINLCGMAAGNYYHLTFEILSRFAYVKEYAFDKRIPVLIDEDAGKVSQFRELMDSVLKDAEVIYVAKNERVRCKTLIYPSKNIWIPINVKRKNDFRISDNLIAFSAIENIQRTAEEYRVDKTERKIFLSRKKTWFSRIVNEQEITKIFEERGFETVYTEDMTYKEQVELFSSASCIVGASGAAFTNIVYCNPETVIGCFMPKKYNFCIYSTIAHLIGCKVLFFNPRITRPGKAMSVEKWKVDEKKCSDYVLKLEELIS